MKNGSGATLLCPVTIGDAEGLFDMRTTKPSGDQGERADPAGQTGAARTGIDMVWTDLDIQAEALVGIAEQ